jgi:hypothetical protein
MMPNENAPAVKRFVIFAGDQYYPDGGWSDYRSSYATLDEARHAITPRDWWQIVDLETGRIVERNSCANQSPSC